MQEHTMFFTRKNSFMKQISGLTLIELLISLTIAVGLLSMLTAIYLAAEKNMQWQTAESLLQQNANIAINILKKAIKTAGFIGCAKFTEDFPILNHSDISFSSRTKINFPDTHTLVVERASLTSAALVHDMRGQSTIYITDDLTIHPGDTLWIADCKTADIFVVKTISGHHPQKITTVQPLSRLYAEDAVVRFVEIKRYFVDPTQNVLYEENNKGKMALIDHIQAMYLQKNTHAGQVMGVAFQLILQVNSLEKKRFGYAALQ